MPKKEKILVLKRCKSGNTATRNFKYPAKGKIAEAMGQVSLEALQASVQRLIDFANQNRQKIILLTKVGCGIAGFDEDEIKEHFREAPANIIKPKEWYA